MSRAMLMTVLARYDGVDTSDGNTWFAKGQGWAVQNKISNGVLPEEPLTREQLVTMLWRYAGQPETAGSLEGFTDADWDQFQADLQAYKLDEYVALYQKYFDAYLANQ